MLNAILQTVMPKDTLHEDVAPADRSDVSLVTAAQNGNLSAFESLVRRHERRIYGLARRMTGSTQDAEDVTQQTFMSAVKGLRSFRGNASFSTWITTIAVNSALKVIRKRKGLPSVSLDQATAPDADGRIPHPDYIADWRATPDRLARNAETRRLLDAAIRRLDPAHRAVFLLRDVEELSVRDTAKALGISVANVKVRLMRARLHLRETLTRTFGDSRRQYTPSKEHIHAN